MYLTTFVFFAVLGFFIWRGYQKGFLGSVSGILGWLLAYPAAIFFSKSLARTLTSLTTLDGVIVYIASGTIIFFSVSIVVSLLFNGISKLIPDNQFTDHFSKMGGVGIGAIMGCIFGLIVVYAISIVKQTNENPTSFSSQFASETQSPELNEAPIQKLISAPTATDSYIENSAKTMVSTAAATAAALSLGDDTATQLTKTFAQDPQTMLSHIKQLNSDGELKILLTNPDFQTLLNKGNTNELMQNKDFKKLMNNPDMQALITSTSDAKNDAISEKLAAEKMITAWQKVDAIKNDPQVIEILSDKTFQQQLNADNKLPLMMNPKLRQLTELLFATDAQNTRAKPNSADSENSVLNDNKSPTQKNIYDIEDITDGVKQTSTAQTSAKASHSAPQEKKIYRWTDTNGKVYYSDTPNKH